MLYLGQASNYISKTTYHLFAHGTPKDSSSLISYLASHYNAPDTSIFLTNNGRSALCLGLKSFLKKGDAVVVNAFTCYAVIEAIRSAGLTPVFADIELTTLNYTPETLLSLLKSNKNIKAFIIQNTLGYPVDIRPFEKLKKDHHLLLIEDAAHCTSRLYPDGREIGTVGDIVAFSFGKGKSIDTITGGALLLHSTPIVPVSAPVKSPSFAQNFRARFYPFFGVFLRASIRLHLSRFVAGALLKLHFIERSADAPLDISRCLSHWQARLALEEFKKSKPTSTPLRRFYLVKNRDILLKKLRDSGYYFDEFWYESPISPKRYYKNIHFPESSCPNSIYASKHIINIPTWYSKSSLKSAESIIKHHIEEYQNE